MFNNILGLLLSITIGMIVFVIFCSIIYVIHIILDKGEWIE